VLHLILPAPLHRLVLRAAWPVRRRWWRWRRPILRGVAVVARDGEGRVLLVRLSYGPRVWSLPAGGRGAGEDPERAARREFAEELGCQLAEMRLIDTTDEPLHGARDTVHVFAARVAGEVRPDGREVVEARFFAPHALPERLERRVRGRLGLP
jgi:ADP-ribose pyrophosphatase YjhB (NUDIX family)